MYLRFNNTLELERTSKKKLFLVVAGIHLLVIGVIYLGFLLQNFFWNKAPSAIAVNLISSSAFEAMSAPQANPAPQPKQATAKQQPTPPKPKETKAVTKVPVKKVTPVKKVSKTLDVSQITKSTQVVTKNPVKPSPPKKTFKPLSANELANTLQKSTNSVKFSSTSATASPNAQVNPALMGYYDQLTSHLYNSWEQPTKLAMGGEPPSVLVKLFIDANGRLTNYQILRTSGYGDMDESVKRLLSSIDRFPPPPDGAMTIEANLILTN